METKITHAWENERYTKWKTSHEDTAPKQDRIKWTTHKMVKPQKPRVEHTELNKILENINVQMVTSAFLQSTMAIITPIKTRTCLGVKTQVGKYHKMNEIKTTDVNRVFFYHKPRVPWSAAKR